MRRVVVAYICNEYDELLMGRRNDNGKWTQPGGHVEKNECPVAAIAREVKEETGLNATNIQLLCARFSQDKKGKDILIYLFRVATEGTIDTSNDPDQECPTWEFKDPIEVCNELHVPAEHNLALKYWFNN